jgi:cysteinyl-tRNA synthetase
MKIYNTLTKKIEDFKPLKKEVKMYTCGPTVYNYAHIGNFFTYLISDTLYRVLVYVADYSVNWVMNVTDVDDKTIKNSKILYPDLLKEEALKKLTNFYSEKFFQDLEKLNIKGVKKFAYATDYISAQQDLIKNLLKEDLAYIKDGSIYFNLLNFKQKGYKYGHLVNINEGFKAGARVNQDEYDKKNVADFVLWKAKKEGEVFWDFYLDNKNLKGRPGWHLECSAIEKETLGLPFDIHTGGVDLKFPHHEDEIAQSLGAYKINPTKYWVHCEHLKVEGKKMSKSEKNFYLLQDIIDKGFSAEEFRLALVINHYRKQVNFTFNDLKVVKKYLAKLKNIFNNFLETKESPIYKKDFQEKIKKFLLNDLQTNLAFTETIAFIKFFQKTEKNGKKEDWNNYFKFFKWLENVWGISLEKEKIPQNIIKLAEDRLNAKNNKDFLKADFLREKINSLGYKVLDQKNSYLLEKK